MYESRNETSTFEIWVKLKAVNFKQICNLIWFFHQIQLLWIFQADKMSSHLVRPDQENKLEGMKPIKHTKAYAVGYDSNMSSSHLVTPVQDILEDMKTSKSSKAYDVAYDSKTSSYLVRPDQDNKLEGTKPIKSTKAYAVGYDSNMSSSQLMRPVQDILENMKPAHSITFVFYFTRYKLHNKLAVQVCYLLPSFRTTYRKWIGTKQWYYEAWLKITEICKIKYLKLQKSVKLSIWHEIKGNLRSQLQYTKSWNLVKKSN